MNKDVGGGVSIGVESTCQEYFITQLEPTFTFCIGDGHSPFRTPLLQQQKLGHTHLFCQLHIFLCLGGIDALGVCEC